MSKFKVGDKVRLTGDGWASYGGCINTPFDPNAIYEVTEVFDDGKVLAGNAGVVYPANPDWSAEVVRDNEGIASDPADDGDYDFPARVREILADIGDLLIEKNNAYGNSALDPVRVFSKADPVEQLRIRLDDKISRIQRGHEYANEDTLKDILGYIVLLMIAKEGAE